MHSKHAFIMLTVALAVSSFYSCVTCDYPRGERTEILARPTVTSTKPTETIARPTETIIIGDSEIITSGDAAAAMKPDNITTEPPTEDATKPDDSEVKTDDAVTRPDDAAEIKLDDTVKDGRTGTDVAATESIVGQVVPPRRTTPIRPIEPKDDDDSLVRTIVDLVKGYASTHVYLYKKNKRDDRMRRKQAKKNKEERRKFKEEKKKRENQKHTVT